MFISVPNLRCALSALFHDAEKMQGSWLPQAKNSMILKTILDFPIVTKVFIDIRNDSDALYAEHFNK